MSLKEVNKFSSHFQWEDQSGKNTATAQFITTNSSSDRTYEISSDEDELRKIVMNFQKKITNHGSLSQSSCHIESTKDDSYSPGEQATKLRLNRSAQQVREKYYEITNENKLSLTWEGCSGFITLRTLIKNK